MYSVTKKDFPPSLQNLFTTVFMYTKKLEKRAGKCWKTNQVLFVGFP